MMTGIFAKYMGIWSGKCWTRSTSRRSVFTRKLLFADFVGFGMGMICLVVRSMGKYFLSIAEKNKKMNIILQKYLYLGLRIKDIVPIFFVICGIVGRRIVFACFRR